MKVIAIILIIAGETAAIYAELIAASRHSANGLSFLSAFSKSTPLIVAGGISLVSGYIFGFKAFKNIWIVSAVSITTILIIEPILNYALFRQLPTRGASVGLLLGIIGFITALVF